MIRGVSFGKMFAKATFERFDVSSFNREAFEACRRLAASGTGGVVLIGPGGVGKTHLLASLARAFEARHSAVPTDLPLSDAVQVPSASELIRSADPDLADDLTAPSLSPDEFEHLVVIDYWPMLELAVRLRSAALSHDSTVSEDCCTCDLLILDDLGHEKTSEFIKQEFSRIVDWRYREMLPIAIATNLSEDQIIDEYGEHTYSRWSESCDIVEVAGEDRRMGRP